MHPLLMTRALRMVFGDQLGSHEKGLRYAGCEAQEARAPDQGARGNALQGLLTLGGREGLISRARPSRRLGACPPRARAIPHQADGVRFGRGGFLKRWKL